MKKTMEMKKYLFGIVAILAIWSCNNSYLEKYPLDSLTEETAFVTADNFRTFSWSFYGALTNSGYRTYDIQQGNNSGDFLAGYLGWRNKTVDGNQMRTQLKVTGATGNGWSFSEIRRCNLMLQNIDGSKMSQADKDHYRSVGYFFRAYQYYELISRFGDVPWINQVVQEGYRNYLWGENTA
jgi:starch-binding outer membrane protein, SusD/RagB family